jgi:hypothetical protein
MPSPDEVKKLIEDSGGTVNEMGTLPDGSGFATASFPLPDDHWTNTMDALGLEPPMGMRMGTDNPDRYTVARHLRDAAKYAYIATGIAELGEGHDPDAFLQNLVVGLLGYHTPDGKSRL